MSADDQRTVICMPETCSPSMTVILFPLYDGTNLSGKGRMAAMRRLELLIPPPLIMLLAGALMWASSALWPLFDVAWIRGSAGAVLLIMLGIVIALMGVFAFRRGRTTMDPRHPADASSLVRSGIYRYSRNPMYLGVLLVLAGWGVYLGNLLSLLWLPGFVAYITRLQIIPA